MLILYSSHLQIALREQIVFSHSTYVRATVKLMAELKEFLTLRDTEAVFAPVRERHSVGVPCVIKEDGTITLDWEEVL